MNHSTYILCDTDSTQIRSSLNSTELYNSHCQYSIQTNRLSLTQSCSLQFQFSNRRSYALCQLLMRCTNDAQRYALSAIKLRIFSTLSGENAVLVRVLKKTLIVVVLFGRVRSLVWFCCCSFLFIYLFLFVFLAHAVDYTPVVFKCTKKIAVSYYHIVSSNVT